MGSVHQTSEGYAVAGGTSSFVSGDDTANVWVLKLDSNGDADDCATDLIEETEVSADDTESTVAESDATIADSSVSVADTSAAVDDTSASIGHLCDTPFSFYFLELSDDFVNLNDDVNAFATTTDASATEVTFRWIVPGSGDIAREVTVPIGTGEDTFAPNKQGEWTVEADFGTGQVIVKTISVGLFVLPESPIGAVAMLLTSIGILGGFLYLKSKRDPTLRG